MDGLLLRVCCKTGFISAFLFSFRVLFAQKMPRARLLRFRALCLVVSRNSFFLISARLPCLATSHSLASWPAERNQSKLTRICFFSSIRALSSSSVAEEGGGRQKLLQVYAAQPSHERAASDLTLRNVQPDSSCAPVK